MLTRKGKLWKMVVRCPYCNKLHKHGGGTEDTPLLGRRAADCHRGEYRISYLGSAIRLGDVLSISIDTSADLPQQEDLIRL
jgi:hypothetical protein